MTLPDSRTDARTDTRTDTRSLDDLVKAGDVAMLTTVSVDGTISSRPLTVAEVHGGVLAFLVDVNASWVGELGNVGESGRREVNVTVSTGRNDWISVRARAATSADQDAIDRLWSPPANAFFENRDDPSIRALQVSVIDGEYWSAPGTGTLGRLVSVVGAALGKADSVNAHGGVARD